MEVDGTNSGDLLSTISFGLFAPEFDLVASITNPKRTNAVAGIAHPKRQLKEASNVEKRFRRLATAV